MTDNIDMIIGMDLPSQLKAKYIGKHMSEELGYDWYRRYIDLLEVLKSIQQTDNGNRFELRMDKLDMQFGFYSNKHTIDGYDFLTRETVEDDITEYKHDICEEMFDLVREFYKEDSFNKTSKNNLLDFIEEEIPKAAEVTIKSNNTYETKTTDNFEIPEPLLELITDAEIEIVDYEEIGKSVIMSFDNLDSKVEIIFNINDYIERVEKHKDCKHTQKFLTPRGIKLKGEEYWTEYERGFISDYEQIDLQTNYVTFVNLGIAISMELFHKLYCIIRGCACKVELERLGFTDIVQEPQYWSWKLPLTLTPIVDNLITHISICETAEENIKNGVDVDKEQFLLGVIDKIKNTNDTLCKNIEGVNKVDLRLIGSKLYCVRQKSLERIFGEDYVTILENLSYAKKENKLFQSLGEQERNSLNQVAICRSDTPDDIKKFTIGIINGSISNQDLDNKLFHYDIGKDSKIRLVNDFIRELGYNEELKEDDFYTAKEYLRIADSITKLKQKSIGEITKLIED